MLYTIWYLSRLDNEPGCINLLSLKNNLFNLIWTGDFLKIIEEWLDAQNLPLHHPVAKAADSISAQ
jgi:hypothetical protein